MTITQYTTPTCATCKVAGKRLVAAGVDVEVIDLTEHPDILAELKSRLDRDIIQVPLFIDESDDVFDITGLPQLLERAKAA